MMMMLLLLLLMMMMMKLSLSINSCREHPISHHLETNLTLNLLFLFV